MLTACKLAVMLKSVLRALSVCWVHMTVTTDCLYLATKHEQIVFNSYFSAFSDGGTQFLCNYTRHSCFQDAGPIFLKRLYRAMYWLFMVYILAVKFGMFLYMSCGLLTSALFTA